MRRFSRVFWLLPLLLAHACTTLSSPDLTKVGEKAPSEDPVIADFHALGNINGRDQLFRSASPIRDLVKSGALKPDSPETHAAALARMQSLRARGITTIISLENADSADNEDKAPWIALEKSAAQQAGLTFVSHPMANKGENSMETLTDAQVLAQLQTVETDVFQSPDGVLIHCSAGHDRTGIVVAYLRVKYQHWPAQKAIDEMRFYGHNWPKYSSPSATESWHETHVRAIATMLNMN
jgi:protein tyrosine phosphatase (PTP) superfamily phosphohydrolase (DUF442 family)